MPEQENRSANSATENQRHGFDGRCRLNTIMEFQMDCGYLGRQYCCLIWFFHYRNRTMNVV